ncbi:unnamed protein product [Pseudo-nitzschia multistriata]|uniref:Uncharacterized protein n=1 Tax=Pseudo-nitzschia multistriata TaxID=183589 RepID=A0A448ZQZ6_9STRA|nr:unnamed protein product [Pseudo-nitzschia multistriata]
MIQPSPAFHGEGEVRSSFRASSSHTSSMTLKHLSRSKTSLPSLLLRRELSMSIHTPSAKESARADPSFAALIWSTTAPTLWGPIPPAYPTRQGVVGGIGGHPSFGRTPVPLDSSNSMETLAGKAPLLSSNAARTPPHRGSVSSFFCRMNSSPGCFSATDKNPERKSQPVSPLSKTEVSTPLTAVALIWTRPKPHLGSLATKASSPFRTSSTRVPQRWAASFIVPPRLSLASASRRTHSPVGYRGWPSLSGRKRTPNSTKGYRWAYATSCLGWTESSTPQRPTARSFMALVRSVLEGNGRIALLQSVSCRVHNCVLELRAEGEGWWGWGKASPKAPPRTEHVVARHGTPGRPLARAASRKVSHGTGPPDQLRLGFRLGPLAQALDQPVNRGRRSLPTALAPAGLLPPARPDGPGHFPRRAPLREEPDRRSLALGQDHVGHPHRRRRVLRHEGLDGFDLPLEGPEVVGVGVASAGSVPPGKGRRRGLEPLLPPPDEVVEDAHEFLGRKGLGHHHVGPRLVAPDPVVRHGLGRQKDDGNGLEWGQKGVCAQIGAGGRRGLPGRPQEFHELVAVLVALGHPNVADDHVGEPGSTGLASAAAFALAALLVPEGDQVQEGTRVGARGYLVSPVVQKVSHGEPDGFLVVHQHHPLLVPSLEQVVVVFVAILAAVTAIAAAAIAAANISIASSCTRSKRSCTLFRHRGAGFGNETNAGGGGHGAALAPAVPSKATREIVVANVNEKQTTKHHWQRKPPRSRVEGGAVTGRCEEALMPSVSLFCPRD